MQYHSKRYLIVQAEKYLQCKWVSLIFPLIIFSIPDFFLPPFSLFFFSWKVFFCCCCWPDASVCSHLLLNKCKTWMEIPTPSHFPPKPVFLLEKLCKIVTFHQLITTFGNVGGFFHRVNVFIQLANCWCRCPGVSQARSLCSSPILWQPCSSRALLRAPSLSFSQP